MLRERGLGAAPAQNFDLGLLGCTFLDPRHSSTTDPLSPIVSDTCRLNNNNHRKKCVLEQYGAPDEFSHQCGNPI